MIENNEIEINAGFNNRYIKVNGEIKDEYISEFNFTSPPLNCLV